MIGAAMLVIRKEQMEALSAHMRRSFEDRMVEHIAAEFPQRFEQLNETGTREFVRAGIARCAEYGIDTEAGIRFMVDLLLQHPEFDASGEIAWARTLLQDPELSGDAKVSLMEKRLQGPTGSRK